ncbi:Twinfilin A [Scheffersomyces coipomensis]|uniref:Twinfilin A n=1 Tax=Scheffersomyces coipomensis TaxID=1788519 RepID=UPI00315D3A00
MSTQSGISASSDLLDAFKTLQSESLIIKISSDNTELIPDQKFKGSKSDSLSDHFNDINSHVSNEYPQPSYILVPAGETDNFIFVSFIPDTAPIRQKMLYASTKNTLINALGSNKFSKNNTFAWTDLDELTHDHYKFSIAGNSDESKSDLLSKDEKILSHLNSLQDLSLSTQSKQLASINHHVASDGSDNITKDKLLYKFDEKLTTEFDNLLNNTSNFKLISFIIDSKSEEIKLSAAETNIALDSLISTLESIASKSSIVQPQFSVYNYHHNKFAFIYSCPSGSKVKDRMLYASSKLGLINYLNQLLGQDNLSINKSIEIGDLQELELSELEIESEISSPGSITSGSSNLSNSNRLKFTKPKGPRRR